MGHAADLVLDRKERPAVVWVDDILEAELVAAVLLADQPAFLEAEGYAVMTAGNGALALERLRDRRPDVVLLDLMMPVMDGWAFLRVCRADPGCADLPVVVLSALDRTATSALAADAFVTKPFDLGDLLATIERVAAA